MAKDLKPITDTEVRRTISLLTAYLSGVTRADLATHFRSDRRARQIIETLVAIGRAAIITAKDNFDNDVYRLARTQEEVEREARKLTSYQESLERRRMGLLRAWAKGGTHEAQKELF